LVKVIKLLLSYGVQAEQNCIFSPLILSVPETNRKSIDMDEADLKLMSKDDLEKFKQLAGPEEAEFANSIIKISTSISHPKQINMEISRNCIHLAKDFLALSEAKHFNQDYLDLLTDLSQGKIAMPNRENNENSIRLEDTVKSLRL
jgi:hypothetical protein